MPHGFSATLSSPARTMIVKISPLETPSYRDATPRTGVDPTPSPDPASGPATRWGARLALVATGILLGIACGEILARAIGFEFRPHMRNRVYFAEPDRLVGWRNRPAISGPYGGDEFTTWVTINPDGQRGRAYPQARTPGTLRVAVLGDSQAWGDGVADDETFAALLERDGLEMLNFACPGYGTDQELLVLDDRAARWSPDVVLIAAFVGNDTKDNLSPGTWQYPKPHFTLDGSGELALHGVPVSTPRLLHLGIEAYRWAMRRSALLNAIAMVTAETPRPADATNAWIPPPVYRSLYTRQPSEQDRRALRLTARLLIEISRHARAIGARPVMLLIPELWQVDVARDARSRRSLRASGADWRRPQRELRRALDDEGIEVVDALPSLVRAARTARPGEAYPYYRGWRHLTARGHRVIARRLSARLGLGAHLRIAPPPAGPAVPPPA